MGYPSVFPTGYYIKFRNEYDTYIWNIFKFRTGISNIGCQDSTIVTNTLLVVIIVSFLNLNIYHFSVTKLTFCIKNSVKSAFSIQIECFLLHH